MKYLPLFVIFILNACTVSQKSGSDITKQIDLSDNIAQNFMKRFNAQNYRFRLGSENRVELLFNLSTGVTTMPHINKAKLYSLDGDRFVMSGTASELLGEDGNEILYVGFTMKNNTLYQQNPIIGQGSRAEIYNITNINWAIDSNSAFVVGSK